MICYLNFRFKKTKYYGYQTQINNDKEVKKPYAIRIDQELLDKVKQEAKKNERSVNAQIRYFIKQGLKGSSN